MCLWKHKHLCTAVRPGQVSQPGSFCEGHFVTRPSKTLFPPWKHTFSERRPTFAIVLLFRTKSPNQTYSVAPGRHAVTFKMHMDARQRLYVYLDAWEELQSYSWALSVSLKQEHTGTGGSALRGLLLWNSTGPCNVVTLEDQLSFDRCNSSLDTWPHRTCFTGMTSIQLTLCLPEHYWVIFSRSEGIFCHWLHSSCLFKTDCKRLDQLQIKAVNKRHSKNHKLTAENVYGMV